jgi:hypothetical protein
MAGRHKVQVKATMAEEVVKDISNINNILLSNSIISSSSSHIKGSSTIKANSMGKGRTDKGRLLRRTLRPSNMVPTRMKRVMDKPTSQVWDSSTQVKVIPASNILRDQEGHQDQQVQEASKIKV